VPSLRPARKLIKFECRLPRATLHVPGSKAAPAALLSPLGLPDSPGVPRSTTRNNPHAPRYNDLARPLKSSLRKSGRNRRVIWRRWWQMPGFTRARPGFLKACAELTRRPRAALLTFEKVMTGFRIAYARRPGQVIGVTPRPHHPGKVKSAVVLPVGAYGGRADIMDLWAPGVRWLSGRAPVSGKSPGDDRRNQTSNCSSNRHLRAPGHQSTSVSAQASWRRQGSWAAISGGPHQRHVRLLPL